MKSRLQRNIKPLTKNIIIVLIAVVTVTSVKVQSASAVNLLPLVPTFTTATRAVYDVMQEQGFVIPKVEAEEIKEEIPMSVEIPSVKYTRSATVTAYNSVPWQTDSTPCIAADGSDICKLREQGEMSCASHLPFGTKINIPGFGVCTVRDRLHPRFAHRIDLYFGGADQIQAAKEWGKRSLTVEVLDS
ncbi:MAG: 3D domain-containing protein [Patescibacteria group bacterium]